VAKPTYIRRPKFRQPLKLLVPVYPLGLAEEPAFGEEAAEEMDAAREKRRGLWPLVESANGALAKAEGGAT